MTSIAEFRNVDFSVEINELFARRELNFGADAVPVAIVKEAVLKSVCGWHNGSTVESIINELGLVESQRNSYDKLTTKGKAFMWWSFKGKYE